jgi:hypothetical protein
MADRIYLSAKNKNKKRPVSVRDDLSPDDPSGENRPAI